MVFGKKSDAAGLKSWTVAELSSFYTEHRSELYAHALRILKDPSRAEEVVQDSLIKVMLAAPELSSADHALSYLHRVIENLCIDIFRIEGRRPNLVLLDDATAELERVWQDNLDHSDVVAAADDAAIVRQALAMLSPAERAALVMWEMEGRSTKEIAQELGIKESSVRHTLSRARASLRRVLSELVIDESRGLTALDLLSITYKRSADIARKSSKAVLSLLLIFFGFLGFNSLSNQAQIPSVVNQKPAATPILPSQDKQPSNEVVNSDPIPATPAPEATKNLASRENAKSVELNFPGLDSSGVPIGFSIADSSGALGTAYFLERTPVITDTELTISQIIKTDSGAANIFISQYLITDAEGLTYQPMVSYGSGGMWAPLNVKLSSTEVKRLQDGNYLFTAYIGVKSPVDSSIKVIATANGRDLATAPRQVITRLVLDPTKTQVLKQAILVVERGAKS